MDYVGNTVEAADKVKYYIKKYGNILFTVILVFMLAIIGMQYWYRHKAKVTVQASMAYDNVLISSTQNKGPEISALADQITKNYPGTPYAVVGALLAAKQAVADNNFSKAIVNLTWAVQHAQSPSIKAIAQIRLARVMIVNHQVQQALDLLNTVQVPEFLGEANSVRGDAYLVLHQTIPAKTAYDEALKTTQPGTALYAYIQMKRYSLSD